MAIFENGPNPSKHAKIKLQIRTSLQKGKNSIRRMRKLS